MPLTLALLSVAQHFVRERGLNKLEVWLKPGSLKALEHEASERGWLRYGIAETISYPGGAYVLTMPVRDMPISMEADAALFDPDANRGVEIFVESGEFRLTI